MHAQTRNSRPGPHPERRAGWLRRTLYLAYGVAVYIMFLGVFVYAIGFIGNFGTPTSLDADPARPLFEALAIDLGLLSLFALQHSVMARQGFKRWWTKIVAKPLERPTYVLATNICLGAMFAFWEPIGGTVWNASSDAVVVGLVTLYMFGWALVLVSTFLIDHFDLFGLKQPWRYFRGKPYDPPKFYIPALYRVVRHPLYLGWLIVFWSTPTMTFAHLVFAVVTTAYVLVAIRFEERDLVDFHGEAYRRYRKQVPMLLPLWRRGKPEADAAA